MSTATRQSPREYVSTRVNINPSTECWEWQLSTGPDGVGRFVRRGKSYSAPQLAYEAFIGEIPEGQRTELTCKTPSCANPLHVKLVPKGSKRPSKGAKVKTRRVLKVDGLFEQCRKGHYYTERNTIFRKDGTRRCDQCRADSIQKAELEKAQHPVEPRPPTVPADPQPPVDPAVIKKDYDGRPLRPTSLFLTRRLTSARHI